MALTQLNQLSSAYKKLLGKAFTSPKFSAAEENLPSLIQLGSSTIFGEPIPTSPPSTLYVTSSGAIVEKVRFELVVFSDGLYTPSNGSLAGTTIDEEGDLPITNGNHTWVLRLSGSYQANSENPKVGTAPFIDGYYLTGSNGTLQIVPPSFGSSYFPTLYDSSLVEIPPLDVIDWVLDTSTGVLFAQDAPNGSTPAFLDAYIYIGKYTDEVISSGSAIPLDTGSFLITASNGGGTDNNITFTKGDGTTFDVEIVSSSYALNSTNAVNAQTASYVNTLNQDVTINGTITAGTGSFNTVTAQVLQVTYISSSVIYSSGSNIFGDELTDTQTLSGSVYVVGNNFTWNDSTVIASNVTSSMSVASASIAQTASSVNVTTEIVSIDPFPAGWKYGIAFYNISASEFDSDGEITSGVKLQGSKGLSYRPTDGILSLESNSTPQYYTQLGNNRLYVSGTTSGNYEIINTGGGILLTPSGGFSVIVSRSLLVLDGITGSLYGTASWAENVISASYALDATSASYALNATSASYALNATSASYALDATSASYALDATSASYALDATSASYALNATSASYALDATSASYALDATSASYALDATSASYALDATSASYALDATSASYALDATSASYALNATSASYALNATNAINSQTASYVNTLNQNVTINGNLTAGTSSLANLTVTNNAVINGDLFVYGSSSVINVENLSIEDKFILVNSGALGTVTNEGGLIVQTTSSAGVAYGTALYYDQEANRWLVAKSSSVAYNVTSIGVGSTTDFIVTVSASEGAPVGSPYNFGTGDSDYSVGQMYIQTDTSDIYIYA